jgi:NAD(P) transhydrogenase subunit alpha
MKIDEVTLYVFMLAAFLGFELIKKVSPLLHTPLMSLTNAISAISVVGAIVIAGKGYPPGTPYAMLAKALGVMAVALAFSNVVGGYMITDRMLKMFKKRPQAEGGAEGKGAAEAKGNAADAPKREGQA